MRKGKKRRGKKKEPKKLFSFPGIPQEVEEVMLISMASGGIVGEEWFKRIQDVITRYPEWFPWEARYRSIPASVHEAYRKELIGYVGFKPISGGIGLRALAEKIPTVKPETRPLEEIIKDMFKAQYEARTAQKAKYKKDKALWDKYYKEYGLEYPEKL